MEIDIFLLNLWWLRQGLWSWCWSSVAADVKSQSERKVLLNNFFPVFSCLSQKQPIRKRHNHFHQIWSETNEKRNVVKEWIICHVMFAEAIKTPFGRSCPPDSLTSNFIRPADMDAHFLLACWQGVMGRGAELRGRPPVSLYLYLPISSAPPVSND